MKLARQLDTLDGLPDELHENYEKGEDGKFTLTLVRDLVPIKDTDQFDELKGALEKQRNDTGVASKKYRDLFSSIEALGGIDAFTELKTQQEENQKANLEKRGEYDKLLDQVKVEHASLVDKKDARIKQLTSQLDREIRGRQVMEAIAKFDGNPTLLQPILMQATRLHGDNEDEGQITVQVFKDDTMLVNAEGQPLSVEGFVERLRGDETYAGAFKGTGNSGGGGSGEQRPPGGGGGGGDGGGIPPELANIARANMTARQKVDIQNALTEKHGGDRDKALNEYMALP